MLTVRRAADRGHEDRGWLESRHTFSFADYQDPRHPGFGVLRAINDDTVAPGAGFPPHRHSDLEIITYVLDGVLEHEDSLGNGSVITVGEVQRMSAGKGVTHSEHNPSTSDPARFLQIWLLPRRPGLPSMYEQKYFSDTEKRGRLRLIASPDGEDRSILIEQDARIYASLLEPGQAISHSFGEGRKGWLHVARGSVQIGGTTLEAGDGMAIQDEEQQLSITSRDGAELLLIDLPAAVVPEGE